MACRRGSRRVVATGAAALLATAVWVAVSAGPLGAAGRPSSTTSAGGPSISTVAGTGRPGTAGTGGRATGAELDRPAGIAVDRSGDLFVADTGACRVDEVPARSGVRYGIAMRAHHLYVVAGTGCRHRFAAGGVGYPTGVAVDGSGDVYVADPAGDRVLELRPSGQRRLDAPARVARLSTVAGTGHPGTAGTGGPATAAELDRPAGVAVGPSGDLYVADTDACRVDEVPATDGTSGGDPVQAGHLYVVAGTGTCGSAGLGGPATRAELFTPVAVAVDAAGDLLIANRGTGQVLAVPAASGTFYGVAIGAGDLGVVAGAGIYASYLTDGLPAQGTTAEVNTPYGVAVAPDGDLYVADTASRAVRLVPAVAGNPSGRAVSAGDMYTLLGAVPSGTRDDGTRWVGARVTTPYGLAVGPGGAVYVSDRGGAVVRKVAQ